MLNFRTSPDQRTRSKQRRDELRAAGQCIGGPLVGFVSRSGVVHGPPVSADKCQRCLDARKLGQLRKPPRWVSIADVLEAHAHLSLASAKDRVVLAGAIRHRRRSA